MSRTYIAMGSRGAVCWCKPVSLLWLSVGCVYVGETVHGGVWCVKLVYGARGSGVWCNVLV